MRASGPEFPDDADDRRADQPGMNEPGMNQPGMNQPASSRRGVNRPVSTGRTAGGRPAARTGRPRWPIPLAIIGALCLVAAAILAWVVVPSRKQLPADTNTTREFTGTANTVINTQALAAGDFGNAIVSDVPVTGERTVRVLATSGDNAQVADERTLSAGGQQIAGSSAEYAVDRRSLEAASDPPADWNVQQHEGLTVSFPIGAEQRDYTGWVADTQSTTPLRYLREEARGGANTYVYQADVPPSAITDQTVLDDLPSAVPQTALAALASTLPAQQQAALVQVLPALPNPVPLQYAYEASTTYWVEPTTGTVVDIQRQEIRTASITGPDGSPLGQLPVYDVQTQFSESSVATAGREASDRRSGIVTAGTVAPWVLASLGILALLAALIGLRMARRQPAAGPGGRSAAEPWDRSGPSRGQPQPPYTGQSPHTGPYRERPMTPEEEAEQRRGRPGQQRGEGPPS
jgi:hypothetical protein